MFSPFDINSIILYNGRNFSGEHGIFPGHQTEKKGVYFKPLFSDQQNKGVLTNGPITFAFLLSPAILAFVATVMDDSLDTILGNAGVDPTLASSLLSDG